MITFRKKFLEKIKLLFKKVMVQMIRILLYFALRSYSSHKQPVWRDFGSIIDTDLSKIRLKFLGQAIKYVFNLIKERHTGA